MARSRSSSARFRVAVPLSQAVPWLAGACAALSVGCGSGGQTGDEHSGPIEELVGSAQRLSASGTLPNSASADGWSFGWKLYGAEADVNQNTFLSPYSVSVAASMLVAGAAGETKAQMQSAFDFSNDGDPFHQARNTVAQALDARNRTASEEQNAQTLRVVNDLWLAPEFRPKAAFLDTLSAYYGASTYLAPFDADPETARLAINAKVAEDTEQLIDDLLPEGSVDGAAFVLTNALYFKARWQSEFVKTLTAREPFETPSGQTVQVDMMHADLSTGHAATNDYVAVSVPYAAGELELVAIMPAAGTFQAFVAGLSAASVQTITEGLAPARIALGFPKLTIDAKVPLKERLIELGMQDAFSPGLADFSALSDANLFISDAFHDATISIDEEGTVAAAATAFVGVPTSVQPDPIPVLLDHPFIFFVRDIETNALLFVGHYSAP